MILLSILSAIIGILSLIYFGIIVLYTGINGIFTFFWFIVGIGLLLFSGILKYIMKHQVYINSVFKNGFVFLLITGVILFLILETIIMYQGDKKPSKDAPYLIVLGASVKGKTITKMLKYRLDKAVTYLEQNPKTKVIVSGGKGFGEDITEALAMKTYLLNKGIDSNRIIEEDQSTNTFENLKFSKKLLKSDNDKVIIVTNNFHVFRAVSIAKKAGYHRPEGLGARSDYIMAISSYVREAIAIIKDKVLGNM